MKILEIILIGIGLAMDAFAVSICKGLSMKKLDVKNVMIIATYFSIFQAFMPIIGYFLGRSFESFVIQIDHWISFVLLVFIGINMIKEVFEENQETNNDDISFREMLILAIATSIDAFAVRNNFCSIRNKYNDSIIYHRNNNIFNHDNRGYNRK